MDNPLRRQLIRIVKSWYFEQTVLILIIANCISLGFDSNRPSFAETTKGKGLELLEYAFLCLFTIEMITKILAMGLAILPGTYLRDGKYIQR